MATRLRNLRVERVDLVDNGASQDAQKHSGVGARVVLFKRAEKKIEERDGKWVVLTADGETVLGTHDTEAEAKEQLRAVEANKDGDKKVGKGGGMRNLLAVVAKKLGISDGEIAKAEHEDLEALPRRVREAFSAQYGTHMGPGYSYVEVVEADHVVACMSGHTGVQYFKIPWSEDGEHIAFEMADREEVVRTWVAKAASFSEALMRRRLGDMTEEMGDLIGAFYETVQAATADADETNKAAAVKRALAEFGDAVKACIADWTVEKAGRKVSAARLKRLRSVKEHIDAIIAEAEAAAATGGEPTNKREEHMDLKGALAGLAAEVRDVIKAEFDRLTSAAGEAEGLRAEVKELKDQVAKATPEKPEDIWKGVHPAVRKAHEDAVKRATDAEALAKSERQERLKGQYIAKAAAFKGLPVKPDDDWSLFQAIDEKLEKSQADRVLTLLRAGDEAVAQAQIFQEVGRGGEPVTGSAEEKINKLAEEFVLKSATPMTIEQARVAVMELHPELYAEHVREARAEQGE